MLSSVKDFFSSIIMPQLKYLYVKNKRVAQWMGLFSILEFAYTEE